MGGGISMGSDSIDIANKGSDSVLYIYITEF
jgi:hypothetical protein